jgi:hypothetical protein
MSILAKNQLCTKSVIFIVAVTPLGFNILKCLIGYTLSSYQSAPRGQVSDYLNEGTATLLLLAAMLNYSIQIY